MGGQASPAFLKALFDTESVQDGTPLLPSGASEEATRLHAIIDAARAERPMRTPLQVVTMGSREQGRFFGKLAAEGYEPFVLNLHGQRVKPKL